MNRSSTNNFFLLRYSIIMLISFTIITNLHADPTANSNNSQDHGTSAVVLIDLSKSFPASFRKDGSIIYGFRLEDQRALETLARVLAELAFSGTSKFKTVWTQIQTSSINANPLCPPLEISPQIVKRQKTITTREELHDTLKKYVAIFNNASKDKNKLGDFTDISGAIAMASDISSSQYTDRVLIILSDFKEDLPISSIPARFKLDGEKVVLLHRPGTNEKENINGYLSRIETWKKKLLQSGAKTVATVPIFAVSETRLRAAIQQEELGTSLTVLVDCKENRFTSGDANEKILLQTGKTLAELSRDMPTPVTALWMAIAPSGFHSKTLPFIEFHPRMIKRDNSMNTVEDFSKVMEELAHSLPSIGKGITSTDISGSLALVCSVDPPAKSSILVIISDFLDEGILPKASFRLAPSTRVVMIHTASCNDRSDPNAFLNRRQEWKKRFLESGATSVCEIPLFTFTRNDLKSCLNVQRKGK